MTNIAVTPRLSIVIACFGQARELDLTLRTFLEQDLDPKQYEMIVVDDHSPDTAARRVVASLRSEFPTAQIVYLRNWRGDGGLYGASARVKNAGLRFARGHFVYFNNSEIAQAGQSMSHILAKMDSVPDPLCLRGRVMDLSYEEVVGLTPETREKLHDEVPLARERVASADHAGLAVVSRRLLIEVGGIDERFDYWGKEDLDLAARLKRAGASYIYDAELKSFHLSHPPNHVKKGDYDRMCSLLDISNREGRIEANLGHSWGVLSPPPASDLSGTVVVHVSERFDELSSQLEAVLYGDDAEHHELVLVCPDRIRDDAERHLVSRFRGLPLVAYTDGCSRSLIRRLAACVRTERLAWLDQGRPFTPPPWGTVRGGDLRISPWLSGVSLPKLSKESQLSTLRGWVASRSVLETDAEMPCPDIWNAASMATALRSSKTKPFVHSVPVDLAEDVPTWHARQGSKLSTSSTVIAVIPHFECQSWLPEALDSICHQTRMPNAVVVIDDGSSVPPLDIVKQYPSVSLYRSDVSVGPYALVQEIANLTSFDALLFHDADDWSTQDRLEILLEESDRTGAELIGSQEFRVDESGGSLEPVCYPADVNHALSSGPRHTLSHATSLLSTDLLRRLGGFATALRFGGDTEMLFRACFVGRVVNVPKFCYFRRRRAGSLTTHPETGLESPRRMELNAEMRRRQQANVAAVAAGLKPDLRPHAKATRLVKLRHLGGPRLHEVDRHNETTFADKRLS